jgi:pimeloyl-ACP methyl ester carboxylesterase
MLEEKQLDIGPIAINYAEGPAVGPPLVMLHGGSARWQSHAFIIDDLIDRWHVFSPDFRGHGKSGRVPGGYRLQDYTNDTARFLELAVEDPAVVVGFSMGGEVGLMVAAQHPGAVRALAVCDSPLTGEHMRTHLGATRARLTAWCNLAGGRYSIPELIERLKDTPTEAPDRAEPITMREKYGDEAGVYEWLATNLYFLDPAMLATLLDPPDDLTAGYEMDTLLPAIECPVLLLQADPTAGGVLPDADAQHALTLLKQVTHVRVAGASHADLFFRNEAKQAFRSFLAAL